ncbi:MAG: hypothetical protein GC129_00140 [Proteobacteria bacterium]|nr:hypothetical protein [Pseudomonadota bacterium]
MRYVLFVPLPFPAEPSVNAMFKAVFDGLQCDIRPLSLLPNLQGGEVPIISAVYTGQSRAPIAQLIRSGWAYVVIDHAWFGDPTIRGTYFRLVWMGFQPKVLVATRPYQRILARLGVSVLPYRRVEEGQKILVLPHSPRFGEIFDYSPEDFIDWVRHQLPRHINWQRDVIIRHRHSPKDGPTAEEHLAQARLVIGFNSELLIRALRMGIPVIGHPMGSVVYAFNRLTPADADSGTLYAKTTQEVERFCATLASSYQGSLEDLAQPGFIADMLENQRDAA